LNNSIRVAVIENDEEFRQAVCGWLERVSDIQIVGEAQSSQAVLRWLCEEVKPDVVLIDVEQMSLFQIHQIAAQTAVILLHMTGQEQQVVEAIRAGALGHLNKQKIYPSQAITAVHAVVRGEAVLSPPIAGRILDEVAKKHRTGLSQDG